MVKTRCKNRPKQTCVGRNRKTNIKTNKVVKTIKPKQGKQKH